MQPTGDDLNILKIKPPMVTSRQSVDFFVDMLDRGAQRRSVSTHIPCRSEPARDQLICHSTAELIDARLREQARSHMWFGFNSIFIGI